jgi:serine/threonine-protein kinase HipA
LNKPYSDFTKACHATHQVQRRPHLRYFAGSADYRVSNASSTWAAERGASTRVLAKRLKKPIVAVDAHRPYLDELTASFKAENLAEFVEPTHADFSALGDALGRFDLLWSEGAAYVLGFEQALLAWHPLLAARGRAAISELSYLVEQPSAEVKEYWSSVYPGISTVVGNCAAAERAGYLILDTITLSKKDSKAYYGPIKARIAELRAEGEVSPETAAVIAEMEQEIGVFERHSDECGYVFYLLEKQGGEADLEPESFDGDADEEDSIADSRGDEDSAVRSSSRRGSTSVRPRDFDRSVAPTNAVTYNKLEQQIVELIGRLGLERASLVLSQVQNQVQSVVKSG